MQYASDKVSRAMLLKITIMLLTLAGRVSRAADVLLQLSKAIHNGLHPMLTAALMEA
jgi:hypothetical protein